VLGEAASKPTWPGGGSGFTRRLHNGADCTTEMHVRRSALHKQLSLWQHFLTAL